MANKTNERAHRQTRDMVRSFPAKNVTACVAWMFSWRMKTWAVHVIDYFCPPPPAQGLLSMLVVRTLIHHHLFQNEAKLRVLYFWRPFNTGKDNRKIRIGTTKRSPRPLNRGSQLTEVLFAVFYETGIIYAEKSMRIDRHVFAAIEGNQTFFSKLQKQGIYLSLS